MANRRTGAQGAGRRHHRGDPNNRTDVIEASLTLFAERGFRATGIRDIADALGIGPTSLYSHVRGKGELLGEIVLSTLDGLLAEQEAALKSTDDVVEQLRRVVQSQVRYLVGSPRAAIVTVRDFNHADPDDLAHILEKRALFRHRLEMLLERGQGEGRMAPQNHKIAAFAIIEMCEAVPGWFRPDGELNASAVAYLYGEYAVRLAGTTC